MGGVIGSEGGFPMPSPFPGMDPYLETPDLWPDVHHELISQIRTALNPALRPSSAPRFDRPVSTPDQTAPGREVTPPDTRVEKGPKRKRGKQPNPPAAVAVVEPIIIPLLLDDEIEEARLEIRHRESNTLVTI